MNLKKCKDMDEILQQESILLKNAAGTISEWCGTTSSAITAHQENSVVGGARLWGGAMIRSVIGALELSVSRIFKQEGGAARTSTAKHSKKSCFL
jgi:hypothetical protein